MSLPDLFAAEPNAEQLYRLFLAHLRLNEQNLRVVDVCREIRTKFGNKYGDRAISLTFHDELEALCELCRYDEAWELWHEVERLSWGRQLNLDGKDWTADQIQAIWSQYSPLLYFLGRYREGGHLLEVFLAHNLDIAPRWDIAWSIINDDAEPTHRCRVTLWHFYQKLGLRLQDWQDWNRFVDCIADRPLKMAKTNREVLRGDPSLLVSLTLRLQEQQLARRKGPTVDYFTRLGNPGRNTRLARLCEVFPELNELPQRPGDILRPSEE